MNKKMRDKYAKEKKERLMRSAPEAIQKEIDEHLLSGDIIDHLRKKEKMEDAERNFWRYNTLWRHIEDHLCYAEECALVDREGWHVQGSSAHSGVRLKGVRLGLEPVITFKLETDCRTRGEYYDDYDTDTQMHWVHAPIDLAVEWNEERWEEWLASEKAELDARKKKEAMDKLKRLVDKYPTEAAELIAKMEVKK